MRSIARADIVAEARHWIGTPFQHQASLRGVGCDCLGLVRGVWRALYGVGPEEPPPYAAGWAFASPDEMLWAAIARHLTAIDDVPAPGDVALFRMRDGRPASHAAIVTDVCHFIHAHDGAGVAEVAFAPWWRRHLVAAFSFPD